MSYWAPSQQTMGHLEDFPTHDQRKSFAGHQELEMQTVQHAAFAYLLLDALIGRKLPHLFEECQASFISFNRAWVYSSIFPIVTELPRPFASPLWQFPTQTPSCLHFALHAALPSHISPLIPFFSNLSDAQEMALPLIYSPRSIF